MRLATDETVILTEFHTIELRPTLRAATRLAQRYGGFAEIARGLLEGNLSVVIDLVREGTVGPSPVPDLLSQIGAHGLGTSLDRLIKHSYRFLADLVGHDENGNEPAGDPMPIEDYHRQLFKIGTGWLGWTPEATWQATPAEIIAAYEGRLDMLKALFGSKSESEPTPGKPAPDGRDPTFDRAAFEALRAKYGRRRR